MSEVLQAPRKVSKDFGEPLAEIHPEIPVRTGSRHHHVDFAPEIVDVLSHQTRCQILESTVAEQL